MKSTIVFYGIFLCVFLSLNSCVNCCNDEEYAFRLRLEIVTSYDQTIKVKYTTKTLKFDNVTKSVLGGSESQFVEFCLLNEPIDLEIHLEDNNKNKDIKIITALLENNNNQMFIKTPERIHAYFVGNLGMEFNKETSFYNLLNNQKDDFYPVLKAREILKKRLANRLSL